jgi:predicted ATPase
MRKLNVTEFAKELELPVTLLLEQLKAAGVAKKQGSDPVFEKDRIQLLEHLRLAHSAEKPAKKITPTSSKTTIKKTDSAGRVRTIQVEVRKRHAKDPSASAGKTALSTPVTLSIKLKSLRFETPPFRKLGNISIPFAERITLIAGHNGIGKSTILGLVANGSGIRDASSQSYLNRAFDANLNEIVHLDFAKEYEEYKSSEAQLSSPFIEYDINGIQLIKRCSITGRTERREVRVVPRNDPHQDVLSPVKVGKDAKVPLPTLYLGMTRMLPVGESNPLWVTSSMDKTIHVDDAEFIETFINSVIVSGRSGASSRSITTQSIKGTGKTTKHPDYPHSAKCISLGQDSLSAIATALASFQKLQREWPSYPGGLLVIDELDAGFHPHAQKRLVKALANTAKKLQLQILATTHSVNLIAAIHPDANPVGPGGKHIDAVLYLTDTLRPRVAEGYTLQDIQRDMSLEPPPVIPPAKAKTLKIYLEDPEAHFVLKRLLTRSLKMRIKREAGVSVKPIPLSVGCGNLVGFQKYDSYFATVLIILDADAPIKGAGKRTQNIIKLPGAVDMNGRGFSPERSLYEFIQALASDTDKYLASRAALVQKQLTSNYLQEYLLDGETNISKRESAKKWMNARLQFIENWGLYELWIMEHPQQVKAFENALVAAAIATAKLT